MKKLASLAAAASMITGQAIAQQDTCDVITKEYAWNVFVVTQTVDSKSGDFCLQFKSPDPRVKGVAIKVDNGEGIVTVAERNCLNMKGSPDQALTPIITTADGDSFPLPTLKMDQALDAFSSVLAGCKRGQISYTP